MMMLFLRQGFDNAQASRYVSVMMKNGFGSAVNLMCPHEQCETLMLDVFSGLGDDDLARIGIETVGERATFLTRLRRGQVIPAQVNLTLSPGDSQCSQVETMSPSHGLTSRDVDIFEQECRSRLSQFSKAVERRWEGIKGAAESPADVVMWDAAMRRCTIADLRSEADWAADLNQWRLRTRREVVRVSDLPLPYTKNKRSLREQLIEMRQQGRRPPQ
jgi:hypothetical protein